MAHENHAERLTHGIDRLTNPTHGIVSSSAEPDIFPLLKNPFVLRPSTTPLVVLTGPSQAGKDTVLRALLESSGIWLHRVKTATSRARRATELPDAKTWLRRQRDGEGFDDYVEALVTENDLIECTPHSGSVYGLPRKNLTNIPEGSIPLIDTDVDGIRTLTEKLAATHSLVSFIVCPENGHRLVSRIQKLPTHVEERIADADRYVAKSFNLVNFALRNPESDNPELTAEGLGRQVVSTLGRAGLLLDNKSQDT